MRIGAKKKPFYRVVAVDERAKRTGEFIELLGTYNPLTEPKEIILKKDRIDYWIKQGAQPSTGYLRIIGKAPQKLPRKPKKASKQAAGDSGQTKTEETAKPEEKSQSEEVKTEEPKVEETTPATPEETVSEAEKPKTEESPKGEPTNEAPSETAESAVTEEDKKE